MIEQTISMERVEEAVNLFGSFDENMRLIERELSVTVVNRDGEIRVDQKRCQSYTPHFIPFMEKPLALSELPKEEWVCHILEESGATFVSLEDFYEPYGKALRSDLIWRIPYGCLDFSGCVLCLVQEGILCLPYDAVDSQEYELFKMESKRLLTKESLLELLQEFNEQTASLATVLMEMGKLV